MESVGKGGNDWLETIFNFCYNPQKRMYASPILCIAVRLQKAFNQISRVFEGVIDKVMKIAV